MKTDAADWTKVGQAHGQAGHQTLQRSTSHFRTCYKGNQIRLLLVNGHIHDNEMRYTNFVGHTLEEEIVQ
jgi:hypothetical protein